MIVFFIESLIRIACTRTEILDYTNRVSKFGQEIADKKRPNAFTFEIWEFMQNAKRSSCRTDSVRVADGSPTHHAIEDNESQANGNGAEALSDNDDDDDELFHWFV